MNEMINKFLLPGYKFMPKMRLIQPGFMCSACGSLIKKKKRTNNLKKQKIQDTFITTNYIKPYLKMIWVMEVLRICREKTVSDMLLFDETFNIAKNLK